MVSHHVCNDFCKSLGLEGKVRNASKPTTQAKSTQCTGQSDRQAQAVLGSDGLLIFLISWPVTEDERNSLTNSSHGNKNNLGMGQNL